MIIAAPTHRTSRHQQRLATMRHAILCGLVAVHGGGNRLFGDANSGSFCIAALQVVCSLA
jgi:hypothetical protein